MLGLVAVALVAPVVAGGCGGGGEVDLTAGLSPVEILEESRAAASAVEFYHPKLTLTLDLTAAPGHYSVARVGDCLQPSSVADAVYSAHRFARAFGRRGADTPPRRERPPLKGRS